MLVAFLLHPAIGHRYASYPLASLLKQAGYDIVYIEEKASHMESIKASHMESIKANGFEIEQSAEKLITSPFFRHHNDPREIRTIFRKDHLSQVLNGLTPDLMIIDNPLLHYGILCKQQHIPFLTFQSCMVLSQTVHTPPINSLYQPKTGFMNSITCAVLWSIYRANRWVSEISFFLSIGFFSEKHVIRILNRTHKKERLQLSSKQSLHMGFPKIAQFEMSPHELDFPGVSKAGKIFFPFTQKSLERKELTYTARYAEEKNEIQAYSKIVVCSLGSMPEKHYPGYADFLNLLYDESDRLPGDTALIIATGSTINIRSRKKNVFIYQFIPQYEVLKDADLMITHGGMNTVKECITLCVPMLVIPLSPWLDQRGNAARVEYHRIGRQLTPSKALKKPQLYNAVLALLNDSSYRRNIKNMREKIEERAAGFNKADLLKQIRETIEDRQVLD